MAARAPYTEEDTPCAQASQLLSTGCSGARGGEAPSEYCRSWLAYAESQCSGQPCERQLCYWMGQCLAGRCAGGTQRFLSPKLYGGSDHVCSFLATTAENEPYLAYRVASQCPLEFQGAPLFEDIAVPKGSGPDIIATLSDSQRLRGPSIGSAAAEGPAGSDDLLCKQRRPL